LIGGSLSCVFLQTFGKSILGKVFWEKFF